MDEAPPIARPPAEPVASADIRSAPASGSVQKPYCEGWMVNLGWLNTALALTIATLPVRYLLKDQLGLDAEQLARFMLLANIPIYVKPFAGILSDALPLCGTRRRHYLLAGLLFGGLFWLLLGLVPRAFGPLLLTYFGLNVFLTVTSTVLGGLMVEVGKREHITGRLSAQRHGINQFVGLISGPVGGFLAKQPFLLTAAICGALHAITAPVYWLCLREPGNQKANLGALREMGRQLRLLVRQRTLWSAAGLIVLVVAAPGFGTPLFYYQTNTLRFDSTFIGALDVVKAACGIAAAFGYGLLCRRLSLRRILALSIVTHAALTLLYLFYRSPLSAAIITGIEAMTMVFALLPLYDLAARGTPKGSEALGYSLMMSVWNFTNQLSDLTGSWLYTHWKLTFAHLVWVNSATTLLVILAVPFLPAALVDRRDGEPERA